MAEYLGATIIVTENDAPHREYLEQMGKHVYSLQRCSGCGHLRYPVMTMCPDCRSMEYTWQALSGKGTIYSYYVVPHAIDPNFRSFVPYPVILVELDEAKEEYGPGRALRIIGNLVQADGTPDSLEHCAIGKRVEVHFVDVGDGWALPQWKLSGEAPTMQTWQIKGPPMAPRPQ